MLFNDYEEFLDCDDGYWSRPRHYVEHTGCFEFLDIFDGDTDHLVHTFVWSYTRTEWVNPTGDNNMENNIATERSYLNTRLGDIGRTKRDELKRQYGLMDDKAPATAAEFVDRIKKGLFVVTKQARFDEDGIYSAKDAFSNSTRWRDPSVKEDKEGYKKAEAVLDKALTDTLDTIRILAPEAGLKALKDFEAQSFK